MFYVSRGNIPPTRHTQHRAPDGSLYAEELFGVEGFSGRSSLLYHLVPPTRTHRIEPVRRIALEAADDDLHRHRLTKTGAVVPIGTTWRLDPDDGSEQRILYLEAPSEIEPPKRYRNDYGQLLEHSPYGQRDLDAPDEVAPRSDEGDFVVHVRSTDRLTAYHFKHHPFDVVGWDGYLWPFRFNIGNFQPITGRVHQPPPVHQTFQARNFVVCSFVPRKFDYHPLAIPAPYNHSNINSDEVIYYVAGNFMSRRGVGISSFTLHPAGIPHGPHPGTAEASIGKEATEELAVMVDTFHPLRLTREAAALEDDRYPYSWLPADDAPGEAAELADRGPEAFPD